MIMRDAFADSQSEEVVMQGRDCGHREVCPTSVVAVYRSDDLAALLCESVETTTPAPESGTPRRRQATVLALGIRLSETVSASRSEES